MHLQPEELPAFVQALAPQAKSVRVDPVVQGMDSAGTAVVRLQDTRGVALSRCFVKTLRGRSFREINVYERVLATIDPPLSPRLLGVVHCGDLARLYLEVIRPAISWPWRSFSESALVLRALARLHQIDVPRFHRAATPFWDYEAELSERGYRLVKMLEVHRDEPAVRALRPPRRAIRKLLERLTTIRRQALHIFPVGERFIHGDMHSSNVMLRRKRNRLHPVLLDWGRARCGHPLEDVSSWLQSLGFWEPEVRRRHDTLLQRYLSELGYSIGLSPDLRDAYWISAASNVLAGAAHYHLSIAVDRRQPEEERTRSARAAGDCFRIFRRAAAAA